MAEEKKLFLLDAMALIYRAFFALNKNPRINSKGLNISAVFGFTNTLLELLRKEKPTHIGVAFDSRTPTARHIEFEAYKAQREKMPEEIGYSIPMIQELLEALKIPTLYKEGFEADDVIGTFAKEAEKQGYTVYMMTPDKDFAQLLSENIFLYKPARMGNEVEVLGPAEVCLRYGIQNPLQFIDMLGMWGDSADNIPGIPGVGEVTARKLLQEFGSLENLLENTSSVANEKLRNKIIENAEQALLSKRLATIDIHVPLAFDAASLQMERPDFSKVNALLSEWEMLNLSKRLHAFYGDIKEDLPLSVPPKEKKEKKIEASLDLFSDFEDFSIEEPLKKAAAVFQGEQVEITSLEELASCLDELVTSGFSAFTIEGERSFAEIIHCKFFCFCDQKGKLYSFSENLRQILISKQDNETALELRKLLTSYFLRKDHIKLSYALKDKLHLLQACGIACMEGLDLETTQSFFDIELAHYLINPESNRSLPRLTKLYLQWEVDFNDQLSFEQEVSAYIALYKPVKDKLIEIEGLSLFQDVEMPLCFVLMSMEYQGVRIDTSKLEEFSKELEAKSAQIEQRIYTYAGRSFNIASPKQLGEILFDQMKIVEHPKQTKTKQYSTAEEVLQKLRNVHPIIDLILEYRSLNKLKSTYADALPALVEPNSSRLHTTFKQSLTSTGRLSSQNPNLQNIPIRSEIGKEIRRAFVPRTEKNFLLAADYSQIELRIIAHLSQDKEMLADFSAHHDIHTATASKVYDVPMEEVSKEMRRNAKTVNFGIIYGISAFGLSERLGIPRKQAQSLIDAYFNKYIGIKKFMQETILFAREHSYVETLLKRRRYLPDVVSRNALLRSYAERNAINAPVQGSSADMIKVAMIKIYFAIKKLGLQSKMILQVHDELVFDVFPEEKESISNLVKEGMMNAMHLSLPLEIDLNFANNWLEAH